MMILGFGFGPGTAVLVAIAAILVFGPKKLPQLGKAAGSTLKEFKDATKGLVDDEDEAETKAKNDE